MSLSRVAWSNNVVLLEWVGSALERRASVDPRFADLAALAYLRAGAFDLARAAEFADDARRTVGDEAFERLSAQIQARVATRSAELEDVASFQLPKMVRPAFDEIQRSAEDVAGAVGRERRIDAAVDRTAEKPDGEDNTPRKIMIGAAVLFFGAGLLYLMRSRW